MLAMTEERLKELIAEAIAEQKCPLTSEAMSLLNDEGTVEVLKTLGKGMTPNAAQVAARATRMLDQVAFSIGSLLMKCLLLGSIGFLVWLAFKKIGVIKP